MGLKPSQLTASYIDYSRFNAQRTLAQLDESQFAVKAFGSATALIDPARACPSLYNRVLGVGEDNFDVVEDLLVEYRPRLPQFDLGVSDAGHRTEVLLLKHGYSPQERLAYLFTRSSAQSSASSQGEIQVERWSESRADQFLQLLCTSFDSPPPQDIWAVRRRYYCTSRFRTFIAYRNDRPAGWATTFACEGIAILGNAFVFPDDRRCGVHTALLQSRRNDAFELGLEWVATDVVLDSQSDLNCRRVGFEPLTVHQLWRAGEN